MTPLGEKIAALIRAGGPISLADYMALCLGDPTHGYYVRAEPFGRGGDFTTAPEISQMFGELIGAWAAATWQAMGAPSPFVLAELGPGRGTLMKDALRATRTLPGFAAAARVHLIETSPRLRDAQRTALPGMEITWHGDVDALPAGPAIVIANEFFDALPIRQFVLAPEGWAERMVGLGPDGGLAFGLRPVARPPAGVPPGARPGAVVETCPTATATMTALAARLAREGGALLAIDYGYDGPATGDTFQAVRAHVYADPLAEPGEADLTVHVDFATLATAARAAGALPRALLTQREFLSRLGIAARAAVLSRGKDSETMAAIDSAVARLTGPDAMGTLFKVLAISSPGLALPVFDLHPAP